MGYFHTVKLLKATLPSDDTDCLEQSMSDIATAIADPSRVSILCALMDGRAWTATELSAVAEIAPSTASAHLAKLLQNQLVSCLSQGRHRYYRLSGPDIAALLETLMGVSIKTESKLNTRTPVRLRKARTCYDHLAGEVAVEIYDFMVDHEWLLTERESLSSIGIKKFQELGINCIPQTRRKCACGCLDWSERRYHLGGSAGAVLLETFEQKKWISRVSGYRDVVFTNSGKKALNDFFDLTL
ncbi:winged helix-turn-helix transcriptional regulator [Salmonella enterica]|uniref:Transcriptional regulator n=3 Tax=Salmonella enterica TaxID=28901 RepID=A0A7Z1PL89_SALET|nr:ArsR family transcriptional regulator [Salmonella enterica]EEE2766874.1 winged helix-turn-helix transcriptional regulator [Salmonella enterica subsp. diarizonae]EEJ6656557.1 winged helix-turn-helix transcriptional regulator [Salmonella enterica subsp. enterica serovar Redlands]PTU38606.1 transcriptional regulator [Salmonella enterica subsp. enterica]EAA9928402.1 ArsR family transcriptional regulator [Salmonella enterica]